MFLFPIRYAIVSFKTTKSLLLIISHRYIYYKYFQGRVSVAYES